MEEYSAGHEAWLYHGAGRLSVPTPSSSSSCSSASRLVAVRRLASSYQHQFTPSAHSTIIPNSSPLTACVTSCSLDCTVRISHKPPGATFGPAQPQHGPPSLGACPSSSQLYINHPFSISPANSLPAEQHPNTSRHPHTSPTHIKMAEIRRKLVIVGDGACGKTCLLM